MPEEKHVVALTEEQRQSLSRLVNSGRDSARKITRARIPIKADEGESDEEVVAAPGAGRATAERARKQFAVAGLDAAIGRRPQPARPDKRAPDGAAEARRVTRACSTPPDGHGRRAPDLPADRVVRPNVVGGAGKTVPRDTVRRAPGKT